VITSISVLFASLVSLTISNLHERQVDIHKSLVVEVHHLRQLLSLLESPAAAASFDGERLREALVLLKQHKDVLFSARYSTPIERKDAHSYIESVLPALLRWSNEQELWHQLTEGGSNRRQQPPTTFQYSSSTAQMIVSQVQLLVHRLMSERGKRWMALQTAPFPMVHYLTLALLASSIVISFLVATAQAEFIFLRGMPVRVLWSVLITSFTALGVVCFDLAKPFGGAYHVL
jgi:Protein of unknown function (DUF4239)